MSAPATGDAPRSFDLHLAHSHAALEQLPEPKDVFRYLLMCMETPRPSFKEERIRQKILDFGAAHGLDCAVDEVGNVRLRKAASPGFEAATAIVLQSHLDMVCSAAQGKQHDWDNDPITPVIEGNILRADGTTLGADDGIGVAASLALLACSDPDFVHGPLEALFTVDEEVGMSGAERIGGPPFLQSSVMINLDSEEAHSACVGCAGGFETTIDLPLARQPLPSSASVVQLHLHSLLGGHTGIDIHVGRANALQLAARMLQALLDAGCQPRLLSLDGGNAPNAIPRAATVTLAVEAEQRALLDATVQRVFARMQKEFAHIERRAAPAAADNAAGQTQQPEFVSSMQLDVSEQASNAEEQRWATTPEETRKLVALMLNLPHGPLKVNVEMDHTVDTSISFSMLTLAAHSGPRAPPEGDHARCLLFCRSSFLDDMKDVNARLHALALLAGAKASEPINMFPGWDPRYDSPALKQVKLTHQRLFGKEAKVYSVHAGLECGLFKQAYPDLDCVSIGPTIEHAHSPQEQLLLDTVEPFYRWCKQSVVNISKDSIGRN